MAPVTDFFNKKTVTPIDLIENFTNENEKRIAPVPKIKTQIKLNNQTAKLFSEETQRVDKETLTRNLGPTKNKNLKSEIKKEPPPLKKEFTPDPNSEPEFAKTLRQATEASGPSAVEFSLPQDIAEGTATNLNTDAHIYASFYNRVSELFYIRWVQRLDSLWQRLPEETKKNLAGRVWQTDLEVLLKPTGEYFKSIIMKPSGFQNFDNAAVFAFQNAKFFPNPPPAKVETDGFIRLRYRISVHVR